MFLSIIFCLNIFYAQSHIVIPLKYYQWYVKNVNADPSKEFDVPVNIPNGIYSALRESNVLPEDILNRFNDIQYRWVAKITWKYYVSFSVDEPVLHAANGMELIFQGLDGIATIVFNNNIIGKATNTFVRYRFDITLLVEKDNTLEIIFDSPINSALISKKQSKCNIPYYYPSSKNNGEKYVNYLRRMQSSFGSNFGPAFPSVGVWKEVELVAYQNDVILRDFMISTVPEEENWNVQITIYYESASNVIESKMKRTINAVFTLENNKSIKFSKALIVNSETPQEVIIHGFIPRIDVKEWWPNGYGKQNLYDLTVSLSNDVINSTKSIRVGFRTIDLVQDYIDPEDPAKGLSFYFAVNNALLFAKGANFLPVDVLPEKASDKKTIEYLLRSSKVANMNMLRVSATGIYQSDYFYELCDEYGILIWQDMMFHKHMYPTDPEFLSSVSAEINQQIKRLQYHPSIALWVGDSGTEDAIKFKWKNTRRRKEYLQEYEKLTIGTIFTEIILKLDRFRPYLKSTPSNGSRCSDHDNPSADFQYGDSHSFLRIGIDSWFTDYYFTPRFASEYGLQSFPSFHTLEKVATYEDLFSSDTTFREHRQHALYKNGNKKIERSFSHHFGTSPKSLMDTIYASQIDQAWSVKLQTEWYRKWRSKIAKDGTGKTMGALYWHLNDVWQAPTWSSIEYGGKWKMLHYYARKFFAPVLVSADINKSGEVTINLTSDLLFDKGASLKIEIFKWDSMTPVFTKTESVFLEKESSRVYQSTYIENLFPELTCEPTKSASEKCFLKLTLLDDGIIISDNYLFPSSFKNINGLQNPEIQAYVYDCHARKCHIAIETGAISLFVWLDVNDISGYFSDNGFMMTEPRKIITFYSENEVHADDIDIHLTVRKMDELFLESFSRVSSFKIPNIHYIGENFFF